MDAKSALIGVTKRKRTRFSLLWLTTEVLERILSDYLTIVDVARLDSAWALMRSPRENASEVIGANYDVNGDDHGDGGLRLHFLSMLRRRTASLQLDRQSAKVGVSPGCWRWMSVRGIHVHKLVVDMLVDRKFSDLIATHPLHFDTIRTLQLIGGDTEDESRASSIVAQCTELVELTLGEDCDHNLYITSLISVAAPSLEILNIYAITDEIVEMVTLRFPQLRHLNALNAWGLKSAGIIKIAQSFSHLTALKLEGEGDTINLFWDGEGSEEAQLEVIRKHGKRLEELSFGTMSNRVAACVAEHCTQLHSLHAIVGDEGFNTLAAALGHRLRQLSLAESDRLTDASVHKLFECISHGHLLDLKLSCRLISDTPFLTYSNYLSSLTRLSLVSIGCLTDDALFAIALHCHQLTSLELLGIGEYISDYGVTALAKANPNLARVVLGGSDCISEDSVWALAEHCRLIENVKVWYCHRVCEEHTFASIEALVRNSQIRYMCDVDFEGCGSEIYDWGYSRMCDSFAAALKAIFAAKRYQ